MNQYTRYRGSPQSGAIPNIIFVLLVANGLLFAVQIWLPGVLESSFALHSLNFPRGEFYPWQLVTYGFLHSPQSFAHIFFNMFALWMFGRELEMLMGPKRFLIYYLTCVIGAGIVQLLVSAVTGYPSLTLGASGGVFGILLAYGMAFPNRTIMLLFPPIPMKAKYFVIIYGVFELYLGVAGIAPGVAHFAHLGGMLFGFLLLQFWARGRRR